LVSCSSNVNQIKILNGQIFKCVIALYLFSSNDNQTEVDMEVNVQMNYHNLSSSSLNGKFIQKEIVNM
jgi:hypothetical protein